MKLVLGVTFATIYALSIRLIFGFLNALMGIMSVTFIILVPVIVGFLTIIFIPKIQLKNKLVAFFLPWLTTLFILVVTMAFNIEGAICWIMIFPLFAILAGFGGLLAQSIKMRKYNAIKENSYFNNKTLNVSLAFVIPVLFGFIEGNNSSNPETIIVEEQILIKSSTAKIWNNILTVSSSETGKNNKTSSEILGFPRHINTVLDTAIVGGKRIAYYEKGLFFEETIKEIEDQKLLRLEITTYPDKIPPTVMDEHILIGGQHLDILEDRYLVEKINDREAIVKLRSKFYINTPFNWYSKMWAKYLMSDMLNSELARIKRSSSN